MDTLILIHDRLSNAVILYMAVVGAWGYLAYFRGDDLGGSLGGTFVIGQVLLIAQTVLGVTLLLMGGRPLETLHYMYGVVIVLLLPFAYTFVRERAPRSGLLLCSSAALLIAALAWRATVTGGG